MTQLLVVTSPRQMLLLAAAIDHGALPPAHRVVVLADTVPVPETGPELATSVALGALARRSVRVVSWTTTVFPLRPASFVPRRDEQPVWERLLRGRWELGDGPVDLVLADPAHGPGRALARVFPHARLTLLADRLERWAPAPRPLRDGLPARIDALVAPELLPGLRPHALDEHGTRTVVVPVRRLVDVVAEAVRLDAPGTGRRGGTGGHDGHCAAAGTDGTDEAGGTDGSDRHDETGGTGGSDRHDGTDRADGTDPHDVTDDAGPPDGTALVLIDAPEDLGLAVEGRDGAPGTVPDGAPGTRPDRAPGTGPDSLAELVARCTAEEVRAAGIGRATVVVHPRSVPSQVRLTVGRLRAAGVDVSFADPDLPAEVAVVRDAPRLVVGTASTSLVTALALGAADVRAVGTADVLDALTPYHHPARTALTVTDRLLAPGADPSTSDVVRLLEAVLFVMHPGRVPWLRQAAVAVVRAEGAPAAGGRPAWQRWIRRRRLERLGLLDPDALGEPSRGASLDARTGTPRPEAAHAENPRAESARTGYAHADDPRAEGPHAEGAHADGPRAEVAASDAARSTGAGARTGALRARLLRARPLKVRPGLARRTARPDA